MNGSYPSRDGGKESDEEADLCNGLRLFGLNERPRLSLECHGRTSSSRYDATATDFAPVGYVHERDVDDTLQKIPRGSQYPSAPTKAPGACFCTAHDALAEKVASFNKPEHEREFRMEVSPGIWARLRGAKETMECVENDFYLPTTCFCCSQDLFCIMDASFVLCPKCRVINPMEGSADGLEGGVGMGFTLDDLREFQAEIVLRHHGCCKLIE